MGRPLKGSVRRRGNRWLASVPRRRGAATRLETSFSTESAAQDWRKRQLKRLEQGLDAVAPDRMKRPAGLPPAVRNRASAFIDMALDWFEERYGEMEKAGAERARNTRRDIELHLAGAFVDLFELDVVQGRQLIKDWMRLMAGHEASGSCALVAPGRTYSAKTVTGLL
jgi:glutathione S-transferase